VQAIKGQQTNDGKNSTADELVITNVQAGLMRRAGPDWYVYEPGGDFQYKSNGECVANGVQKPCLWYGYTFSYVAPKAGTELDCTVVRSRPQNMVSPRGEHGVKTDASFELRLPNKSGRFESVGYQTPKNELPGKAASKTVCTYKGHTVFEHEFGVTFTANDIAGAI
jgi:hypothetical protein